MGERKVAIITYSMIPYAAAWGSCQRMYYLANSLLDDDYEVTVFSAFSNQNEFFGKLVRFNSISIPIQNSILKYFVYSKKANKQSNEKSYIDTNKGIFIISKIRNMIKHCEFVFFILTSIDKYLFNEPSYLMALVTHSWCKSAKEQIINYLKKNGIMTVVISVPPFGIFSIAKFLKSAIPGINIIFDYRDPWNLWQKKSYYAKHLEKIYLKYADFIIFTNENLANDMIKEFGINQKNVGVVANGYSEKSWEGIENKICIYNDKMVITYAGAVDISPVSKFGYRDVTELLSAFEKVLNLKCKVKLVFVGAINPDSDYAKELKAKFKDNIHILGSVNNSVANQMMVQSDILLLLHTTSDNSSKYLVSGKLYDYIKAGKYIVSIGAPDGLHANIISKYNIGMVCKNNADELFKALIEIYRKWEEKSINVNIIDIETFSREYQNRIYMGIIDSLEKK